MDRRKSIKALLVRTASAAVLVESCKTEDKKTTDTAKAPVLNEDDRMVEEKELEEKLMKDKFFTDHEMATIAVLSDIIIPKDEVSGSATDAKVPDFIEFIVKEKSDQLSKGDQDFSDTSISAVLQQMPFPAKCQPVKGFFPESAKGIDDKFVFVSLDADLFEPIYSGLQFFYPRLVKGGYIFIHDFNNDLYKGSRKAVEQFCSEQNIGFVPLPDSGGSAIIAK